MGRLIDGDALYKAMQDAEELAMQRVLDTESTLTLPYPNNLNPAYIRYLAQLNERTKAKEMVADAPTVDAVEVVRCADCIRFRPDDDVWGWCTVSGKMRCKDYCSYGVRERQWMKKLRKDDEQHGVT